MEQNYHQILSGIKVLELGQLIAGPFASKTLADFGAEVIKVESPKEGDPLRKWRISLVASTISQ
jgi:formyl-CoA transferase